MYGGKYSWQSHFVIFLMILIILVNVQLKEHIKHNYKISAPTD